MNLLQSLLSRVRGGSGRARREHSGAKAIAVESMFGGVPLQSVEDVAARIQVGTGKLWATWRAIDLIAKAVVATPFSVIRKESTTTVNIPELKQLMQFPNQDETWRDFLYRTIFHYRLTGSAYWLKSEATLKGDRPKELYTLNPRLMEPVISTQTGLISGWWFYANGQRIPLDKEEVIVFRRPHPDSLIRGMGDVEAGESMFSLTLTRNKVREKFLKNGAMPSGLLINKVPFTDDEVEWEKAKKKFNAQYGGVDNAGKTAWVSGDWTYQKLGMTLTELQELETQKYSVEEIFHLHGVPLSVAGIRDAANYATADIDNQRFKEYTVKPDVLTLQDTITTDLVEGFRPDAELKFAVTGLVNIGKIAADYAALFRMGVVTINEIRAAAGLPVDKANPMWEQTFIESGLVPLEMAGMQEPGPDTQRQAEQVQQSAAKRAIEQGLADVATL